MKKVNMQEKLFLCWEDNNDKTMLLNIDFIEGIKETEMGTTIFTELHQYDIKKDISVVIEAMNGRAYTMTPKVQQSSISSNGQVLNKQNE